MGSYGLGFLESYWHHERGDLIAFRRNTTASIPACFRKSSIEFRVTFVSVRLSDSNFSSFMSSFAPVEVTPVFERSRDLKLEKLPIACIPLSVTLVRASSASTIRFATGASCVQSGVRALCWSAHRPQDQAVRRILRARYEMYS